MVNKSTAAPRELAPGIPRRRRGPGRPPAAAAGNVRERLLEAARELFLRYGYRGVSSRQIGAAAGVNFAMIRYYFGGKPGLYREILQGALDPQLARLLAGEGDGEAPGLAQLLANVAQLWAANPWIAGFVVREVLTPGGPMRTMFLRDFPGRLVPLLERRLAADIAGGRLRGTLDAKLLVLSVLSLAIFPFLAYPLTSRLFGVRNDAEFLERFLEHTRQLLAHGVTAGGAPLHPPGSLQ
ncbi:MAG TPA: TetR/AcrR family transcriptional regulator [Steroidobacteraceae bacterium]|nr:TetR/AcrR family transcriptional regulator [Steroidobacteraceae bacterium]